jgi:flagellin
MSLNSVNTNSGALVALQNLNATNRDLATTQGRINTGLKVANAKDNGATWAIAQGQRAEVRSLGVVKESLARGQSVVDVAMAAGETVSDLLTEMKSKALAASDTSLDAKARTALANDFNALRDQIGKAVNNAEFDGINMLKTGGTTVQSLANAKGTSTLTVAAKNLSLGTQGLGSSANGAITASSTFTSAAAAKTLVSNLDKALSYVSSSLASLGTGSKALGIHAEFVGKLADSLEAGIGNLVDADLAKESAKLQSLQTKQQLGVQALSIANSSTSSLLGLFR